MNMKSISNGNWTQAIQSISNSSSINLLQIYSTISNSDDGYQFQFLNSNQSRKIIKWKFVKKPKFEALVPNSSQLQFRRSDPSVKSTRREGEERRPDCETPKHCLGTISRRRLSASACDNSPRCAWPSRGPCRRVSWRLGHCSSGQRKRHRPSRVRTRKCFWSVPSAPPSDAQLWEIEREERRRSRRSLVSELKREDWLCSFSRSSRP